MVRYFRVESGLVLSVCRFGIEYFIRVSEVSEIRYFSRKVGGQIGAVNDGFLVDDVPCEWIFAIR
jgi:hypothetical protein